MKQHTRDERLALTALGAIVAITAGWWALALWPIEAAPEWLSRTRAVCFGAVPGGLPDGGGWILLIGQPTSMLAFLMVVWGGTVRRSVRGLAAGRAGRWAVIATTLAISAGLLSAGIRVLSAAGQPDYRLSEAEARTYPRLDRAAPALRLVDQAGREFDLAMLRGRTVLLTFAYAHCETVCPVVVKQSLAARDRADAGVVVAIVTLDPWRDTPARLPSIAQRWGLGHSDYVLGGEVGDVLSVLEDWNMPITRHGNTGLIDHPAVSYVIDADGRVAFASTGGAEAMVDLLRRVRSESFAQD